MYYLLFHKTIHDNLDDICIQCGHLSRYTLHYSDTVVIDKDLEY
jgi:hypothetical protein